MDFDTDAIITKDEPNEWNESLDNMVKEFTKSKRLFCIFIEESFAFDRIIDFEIWNLSMLL